MKVTQDQALIGTEAIKAFTEKFGPMNDTLNKIILEELLKILLESKNETRII